MCANEQALARLEQEVKSGECVAFVGSGLSVPQYPCWVCLVRCLCRGCGAPFPFDAAADPDARASRLQDLADSAADADPAAYANGLRGAFATPGSTRRAYQYLARLPFKAYVTTNFDSDLVDALALGNAAGGAPRLYSYPVLPVRELHDGAVYYLHGRARPEMTDDDAAGALVLGARLFRAAYGGEASELASFLRQVLAYEKVLFVGFSLSDPNFRALLGACESARSPGVVVGVRYALLPSRRKRVSLSGEADGVGRGAEGEPGVPPGVCLVPYDPVDDGHSGLDQILKGWCGLPPLADNVGFTGEGTGAEAD